MRARALPVGDNGYFGLSWGPLDLDFLEYAGVLRKSSLNQVTQNSWSTLLVNQVSDSKIENKTCSEKMGAISSIGENEWKTIKNTQ